jgi:hypothetical protein
MVFSLSIMIKYALRRRYIHNGYKIHSQSQIGTLPTSCIATSIINLP